MGSQPLLQKFHDKSTKNIQSLHLILILTEENDMLQSISPSEINHKMTSLWTRVHWIIPQQILLIKYSLSKILPANFESKSIYKFEILHHWKIGFNVI